MDMEDGKAPDALRTIGEVASALGVRQHVLRYWEEQFPMLRPLKRSGGRRYYRAGDVELVRTIDRLVHHEGYTLRGARQVLESGAGAGKRKAALIAASGVSESAGASEPASADPQPALASAEPASPRAPEPVLSGLRLLRDRLAAALAAA